MLIDNHGRPVTYLRLAVTDRCNLRCQYCMPAEGLNWTPRSELLSFEEMLRLLRIVAGLGVSKLRLTGGEPFLRKDLMQLLRSIHGEQLFESISITTNGTLTLPHIPELNRMNIHSVNLSVDSLDPERFYMITRRKDIELVSGTLQGLLDAGIRTRINAVIMEGKNEQDLKELAALSLVHPIGVRFIEEMPFNGSGQRSGIRWNWRAMLSELQSHFPELEKMEDEPHSTSLNYRIPGAPGTIGLIPAYTRSFCGTCNRMRITPQGMLKTCLYDNGVLDLRKMLREGSPDHEIASAVTQGISHRAADGFEAERNRTAGKASESMATIGG